MSEFVLHESELLGECYYSTVHKSGLPIYVFPKQLSVTHALFAVNYGSIHNVCKKGKKPPFPHGLAHFLEHKLFINEDGSDAFEHFSALGADANAYTSHSKTVYLFSATDNVTEALGELVHFVTHPYFTPESVEKEQGIIAEEIRSCHDNPYDRCYYNMLEGLYHNHPVKKEICGSVRSIGEITDQTLYDCYRAHYRLSNMLLVVCGDVTPEEVLAVADAHLPMVDSESVAKAESVAEPATVHRQRIVGKGQVAKPIFTIGIKDVNVPTDPIERCKRDVGMAILSEMLFSSSGEFYHRLFDAAIISPDFSADYSLLRDIGFMQISGEANDPQRVLDEVVQYLDEVRQKGLSEADFERCRRVEFAEYIKSFDSTEEIASTLLNFVFEGASPFEDVNILKDLQFSEVQEMFATFFDVERMVLSVIEPRKRTKGE